MPRKQRPDRRASYSNTSWKGELLCERCSTLVTVVWNTSLSNAGSLSYRQFFWVNYSFKKAAHIKRMAFRKYARSLTKVTADRKIFNEKFIWSRSPIFLGTWINQPVGQIISSVSIVNQNLFSRHWIDRPYFFHIKILMSFATHILSVKWIV